MQKEKELRAEQMKQRLVAIAQTATDGVRDSLSAALGIVTDAAVAEMRRQVSYLMIF